MVSPSLFDSSLGALCLCFNEIKLRIDVKWQYLRDIAPLTKPKRIYFLPTTELANH